MRVGRYKGGVTILSVSWFINVLIFAVGLSLSTPGPEPYKNTPQCYLSGSLRPIHASVCPGLGKMDAYNNCTAVYIPSSALEGIVLVGWSVGSLEDDEPAGIALPGRAAEHEMNACLCQWWERFPEYVFWEDVNPCGAPIG